MTPPRESSDQDGFVNLLRFVILIAVLGSSVVAPVIPLSSVPVLASQLLANGDFEQDTMDPWRVSGLDVSLSRTSLQKNSGNYGVALVVDGLSEKWMYQTVLVTGGNSYSFRGYVLKNDAQATSVFFRIAWYESIDGTGPELASHYTDRLTGDFQQFRLLSVPATAPLSARSARVMAVLRPASVAGGTAYFDDLSLEGEVSTPTASPTPTLSPTPSPTATATSTSTPTATPTSLPTATPSPLPTPIPTPSPTPTPTPSPTPEASASPGAADEFNPTATALPTATSEPGTFGSHGEASVLISEVMVNPVEDPQSAYEWVELYNAGSQTIEMESWSLADNLGVVALPATALGPHAYLVVAPDIPRFREVYAGFNGAAVESPTGRIGNGLSNEADMVVLMDPSGQLKDSVNWGRPQPTWPNYHSALWDPGLPSPPSGYSLGRVAGQDASMSVAAWTSSAMPSPGGPTPSVEVSPTPSATASPTAVPTAIASLTSTPPSTRTRTPTPRAGPTTGVVARPYTSASPLNMPVFETTAGASPFPGLPPVVGVSPFNPPLTSLPSMSPASASSPIVATLLPPTPSPSSPALLTASASFGKATQQPQVTTVRPAGAGTVPEDAQMDDSSMGPDLLPLLVVVVPALGLIFYLKGLFFS